MAGTIIADFIRTDANQLSLNVGNTTFATINSSGFFSNTGVQIIDQNGRVNGSSILSSSIPISSLGSGTILKTNMNQTSMPSNTICQVVRALDSTVRSQTSNNTPQLAGSVTITPKYSNSLIIGNFNIANENSGTADLGTKLVIYRVVGGTIAATVLTVEYDLYESITNSQVINRSSLQFTDSPGTTSAVTYQYAFAPTGGGAGNARINQYGGATSMVVMEVSP
jgi:hypothetical protein